MSIPIMVPIETAAEAMQAAPSQIRSLVALGATGAAQTADGSVIVSLERIRRLESILVEVSNLNGKPIHVSAAAKKYDIPIGTLSRWAAADYIETLGHEGNRRLLNEADIAFISLIRKKAGMKSGQSLASIVKRLTD